MVSSRFLMTWQGFGKALPGAIAAVFLALFASGGARALTPVNQAGQQAEKPIAAVQARNDTLVVGSEQDYPPFATGMTDATAGGFTVDLWKAVAAEAGLNYTIRVRPFHQLMREFKDGMIDVLINLAQSDERRQFADFTVPHVVVHGAIFVRKGDSGIRSEVDLSGKSIIVLSADLAHDYAVSKGWEKQLVLVDTSAEGLRLLASGRHDAMLLSKLAGMLTLQSSGLTNIEALTAKAGFSQKFAFAVRAGQSELLGTLNEGLALAKSNGTYDALYDKWFGIYEAKEAGWRDLLKYFIPIVASFLVLAAVFFYRRRVEHMQAEEALRESEERYRALVEWSREAIAVHRDGKLLYVNPAAIRMFGAESAQELIGRAAIDLVHPDFRQSQAERVKNIANHVSVAPMVEARFLKLDGTAIDVEVQGTSIVYDGAPAIHASMRDVTARKQVEDSLEENREKYRALSDAAFEAIFISEKGQCLEQNKRAEEMFGYSAEEAIGRPGTEWIATGDRDRVTRNMLTGYELPYEATGLRKDGSTFPAIIRGKMMHFKGRAVRVTSMRDLTERKQAEAALKESEGRYRALVEWSPQPIIVHRGGKTAYVNPAAIKMFGATSAQTLIGKPIIELAHPDFRQMVLARMKKLASGGSTPMTEMKLLKLDGTAFDVEIQSTLVTYDGEPAVYAVMRDITAHKQAEAAHAALEVQLRESQKMEAIGTLAGGIAHDFNNILAAILGNTELARQDVSANPLALESLEEIRKAASRARDLVRQILSFSRRRPGERKLTALAPIIEESARLLRATLPARLILEIYCDAAVPPVLADTTLIEQAVINLATNAMQALRGGPGHVGIRLDTVMLDAAMALAHPALHALHARYTGRVVRLAVSDDGPGMDAATRERIFEPFFTTKAVNEGTGLGLSVVHGIVRAHGGAIEVDSQPGQGATFTIYLPVAGAEAGTPAPDEGESAPAASTTPETTGGQHILYLDDDESLVFLVTRLLERRGYRISSYTRQREALAALRAEPAAFDLVVTDYNMPGLSGLDVAREVRAIRADLPVAIASGFIDETLQAQAEGAGVRELIFKANAVEDLCDAFARLARAVAKGSKHVSRG